MEEILLVLAWATLPLSILFITLLSKLKKEEQRSIVHLITFTLYFCPSICFLIRNESWDGIIASGLFIIGLGLHLVIFLISLFIKWLIRKTSNTRLKKSQKVRLDTL